MEKTKISLLIQIINSMKKLSEDLESSYLEKNKEKLELTKKNLIELQKRLNELT